VYQLNTGRTSVRNKVFFSARFYCALLTLHVSAPFGGHLQVVRKHTRMRRGSQKNIDNVKTHPQSNTRQKQLLLTNNYHIILYFLYYILYLYFRVCSFSAVCICCITAIFAYICLLNGSIEYMVTALDIFVFTNHLMMAAKRGRNV
jgi:hypothetical protein